MASFTKRGNTWQYTVSRYVDGVYKPIRKGGFRTKREAEIEAREIETLLDRGYSIGLNNEIFHHYFDEWHRLYKVKISDVTRCHYEYTHRLIKEHLGNITLQEVTHRRYQNFINDIGSTRALVTIDKVHRHIRACIKVALQEKRIEIDFTQGIELNYTNKSKPKEDKYISYKESQKLLYALQDKIKESKSLSYYAILLALTSGFRFGEIVGLTREDFNFKERTITVNKTWGYYSEMPKGFGPTKNEQSNRTIQMDKTTMNIFEELFNERVVDKRNPHNLVFFNRPDTLYKVISNSYVNRTLKRLLNTLNIEPIITIHGLRHTHASILIYKKDISINYISERLGHSTVTTTLEKYSHVLKELRAEDEGLTEETFEGLFDKEMTFYQKDNKTPPTKD